MLYPSLSRVLVLVASADRKRRLRLAQWLIASLVYVGAAALLVTGVGQGWMNTTALSYWLGFVGLILFTGYIALRSGWTERFKDPSITLWQLSAGVIAVNWGYFICGPMRTSALFPIMVIFAFGAFALRWRQIAFLTVLAVGSLIGAVVLRQIAPDWVPAQGNVDPLRVDVNNILMLIVVLPALAVIAARLSNLRQKLKDQRVQLTHALEQVERLATSDELTGLPNRRSVKLHLERGLALSSRHVAPMCIAILDIDHFKSINDTFGHAEGDSVLRKFAALTTGGLRATDVMGRWGGEEFLLLLPGGCAGMASVLERMRQSVHLQCSDLRRVTFSAGVAQHRHHESLDDLLARADAALYRAKAEGRNRVCYDGC